MNFLFVKLSHHCLRSLLDILSDSMKGWLTFEGPTPPGYNLACRRMAISCRTWAMYLQPISSWIKMASGKILDIRSQRLRILTIPRGLKSLVKRKRHVTGNREMVESSVDKSLSSLAPSIISHYNNLKARVLPSQPPSPPSSASPSPDTR